VARVYHSLTIGDQEMAPGAATVSTPALRYWRTRAFLRQTELATRAGVGIQSVHRGEAGKPLQLATVRKLAEALDVTPAQLQAPPPG
jgi:transcriptional regulator with XRE-family HTH domain